MEELERNGRNGLVVVVVYQHKLVVLPASRTHTVELELSLHGLCIGCVAGEVVALNMDAFEEEHSLIVACDGEPRFGFHHRRMEPALIVALELSSFRRRCVMIEMGGYEHVVLEEAFLVDTFVEKPVGIAIHRHSQVAVVLRQYIELFEHSRKFWRTSCVQYHYIGLVERECFGKQLVGAGKVGNAVFYISLLELFAQPKGEDALIASFVVTVNDDGMIVGKTGEKGADGFAVKLLRRLVYLVDEGILSHFITVDGERNDHADIVLAYQLYKTLLDIILYKIPSKRDIIQHALKILRLIINNKNGVNLLNYIISGSNQDFLIHLQKIYFEKPYHLLIQSEVFNFLQTVFNMAKSSYKNNLLSNELHIFTLTCLEDCYQEFMTENKDNNSYIKLVIQILKLLSTILEFGNNDLNLKISLKNCCEEKNIYHILSELNYSKNGDIQDLVAYLNENFFDGYENEEYSEDYC